MNKFIDQAVIEVFAGDGGNGAIAWRREKYEPLGGPAGGNGGRGGHVYFLASEDISTLIDFRFLSRFQADHGARGGPKGKHGKAGKDLVIKVPVGTMVRDAATGLVVADMVRNGQKAMVAEGGRGGRGNSMLASSTRRAPHFCEPGQPGVGRKLDLELKLLADVGIIGLPNAGKSTLLSVLTRAKPKIADYPFSTLEPNLGVVQNQSENALVLADIPGLIEGASKGLGLGHKFLKHVERTRMLVHLVDVTSEDIFATFETINQELQVYKASFETLPQILVLSKADLLCEDEIEKIYKAVSEPLGRSSHPPEKLFVMSAVTHKGLDEINDYLVQRVSDLKRESADVGGDEFEPDAGALDHGVDSFSISRRKNVFFVEGDRVERLVAVTDLRDPESIQHLHHVLRAMGVMEQLMSAGITQGSDICVGGATFVYGEDL